MRGGEVPKIHFLGQNYTLGIGNGQKRPYGLKLNQVSKTKRLLGWFATNPVQRWKKQETSGMPSRDGPN